MGIRRTVTLLLSRVTLTGGNTTFNTNGYVGGAIWVGPAGVPAKIKQVKGNWIKVEEVPPLGQKRFMWINLNGITAIWSYDPIKKVGEK